MPDRKIRVLIAKPGLDGHEIGAVTVARGLRDEGMEVIYTGLFQTPEKIIAAAIQEDVDVIGCSILSGAHLALMSKLMTLLKGKKISDRFQVIVGGPIPMADIAKLKTMGVAEVFPSRSEMKDISKFIREHATR
jgi:methylmalonyl-CoA mutase C-terminal domain/subunit